MAIYAIGDVHGCADELETLLEALELRTKDKLWFVGDLVNRGPASLRVLEIVRGLGDAATTVLGNHDLHLIACALDVRRSRRATFGDVLASKKRNDMIEWLRHRPLVHRKKKRLLVHAGLDPRWTVHEAEERARDAEDLLRTDEAVRLLGYYRPGGPVPRDPDLARAVDTLFWTTRVRCVRADGTGDDEFTGPPHEAPRGLQPWFSVRKRKSREVTVVFGHWAALGLYEENGVLGLDTGCVWGRCLTAMRLKDGLTIEARAQHV